MATSTPKKDSRDSALNVHKFYGHQRHIDRSLHPVNQSVENFNDRDCDVPRLDVLTYARHLLLWAYVTLLTYCEDEFCVLVYFR